MAKLQEEEYTPLYKASMSLGPQLNRILEDIGKEFSTDFQESKLECSTGEYTLKHSKVHEIYVGRCESLVEAFLEEEDVEREEFINECEESIEGNFCALFEEDVNIWFVELLQSISDFSVFHKSLCRLINSPTDKYRHK